MFLHTIRLRGALSITLYVLATLHIGHTFVPKVPLDQNLHLYNRHTILLPTRCRWSQCLRHSIEMEVQGHPQVLKVVHDAKPRHRPATRHRFHSGLCNWMHTINFGRTRIVKCTSCAIDHMPPSPAVCHVIDTWHVMHNTHQKLSV